MWFFPYFVCVLLGVDSLRGGLAEGNTITSQRLLDQTQAGVYSFGYRYAFHKVRSSGLPGLPVSRSLF